MFSKFKDKVNKFLAGSTRYKNKFSTLKVLNNSVPLNDEFIKKYVLPFYMLSEADPEYKSSYLDIRGDVNIDVISKLLGEFDWRPRSVGAYFAAIENKHELQDNIGRLLLRSDVCYTGHNYCLALASLPLIKV